MMVHACPDRILLVPEAIHPKRQSVWHEGLVALTSAAPPNILFVLPDQLGARWLPTNGHATVSTPHLGQFADESTVFERAISTSPVCTPYRGCLLSGLYPSQTGVLGNGQPYPADVRSLADHLNDGGYATYYVGKWHLSGAPQENRWVAPHKRAGFQHFVGWESHHVDHYAGLIWRDDPADAQVMSGHEDRCPNRYRFETVVNSGTARPALLHDSRLSGAAPTLLPAFRLPATVRGTGSPKRTKRR